MMKIDNLNCEAKEYRIISLSEELAFYTKTYYKYFRNNHTYSLDTLYNDVLNEIVLNENDKQRILNYATEILKYKYKLERVNGSFEDKLRLKHIEEPRD